MSAPLVISLPPGTAVTLFDDGLLFHHDCGSVTGENSVHMAVPTAWARREEWAPKLAVAVERFAVATSTECPDTP